MQHSSPVKSAHSCSTCFPCKFLWQYERSVIQRSPRRPCRSVRNSTVLHQHHRRNATERTSLSHADSQSMVLYFFFSVSQSSGGSKPIALTADTRAEDANQFLETGIRAGATAELTVVQFWNMDRASRGRKGEAVADARLIARGAEERARRAACRSHTASVENNNLRPDQDKGSEPAAG